MALCKLRWSTALSGNWVIYCATPTNANAIPDGVRGGSLPLAADAAFFQLQQFHVLGVALGAEDEPERGTFAGAPFMPVEPAQVELELAFVRGLELAELEFDGHQPSHAAVEEEQIKIVVLGPDAYPLLARDEGEIAPEFYQEALQLA
jgi:hypothetical protein